MTDRHVGSQSFDCKTSFARRLRFNGKLRNECLNQHWFTDLDDARQRTEAWRVEFNEARPHSVLDGMTPKEYAEINRELASRAA